MPIVTSTSVQLITLPLFLEGPVTDISIIGENAQGFTTVQFVHIAGTLLNPATQVFEPNDIRFQDLFASLICDSQVAIEHGVLAGLKCTGILGGIPITTTETLPATFVNLELTLSFLSTPVSVGQPTSNPEHPSTSGTISNQFPFSTTSNQRTVMSAPTSVTSQSPRIIVSHSPISSHSPTITVSHSPPLTAVIASVLASIGFIVVFILSIFYLRRRRLKRNVPPTDSSEINPYRIRTTSWISPLTIKRINESEKGLSQKAEIQRTNVNNDGHFESPNEEDGQEDAAPSRNEDNRDNAMITASPLAMRSIDNLLQTEEVEMAEGVEDEDGITLIARRVAAILRETGLGEHSAENERVEGHRRPRRYAGTDDAIVPSILPPAYEA